MEIYLSLIILVIALFAIVFACIVFTNAIEHFGEKLNLSEGAVGSVLAAVGTALPETIVPLVAIIGANITGHNVEASKEIGIGAILGAPFLLGTLAFFITGFAVFYYAKKGIRKMGMSLNTELMIRDFHVFALAYTLSIAAAFIPFETVRVLIACSLPVIYLIYVVKTVRTPSLDVVEADELDSLYLTKFFKMQDNKLTVLFQVLIGLAGIIAFAHVFVHELKFTAGFFNLNPLILSLIITPIATELPEKINSVIWIKAKKDTLSIGNITGAMVFQSCIPTAVGILLTPWVFKQSAIVNILIVYLSVGLVYLNLIRTKGVLTPNILMMGGVFYLVYLVYVLIKIF